MVRRFLAILFAVLVCALPVFGGKRSASSGGKVYVHGYTTRKGTYVAPHYRNAPRTSSTSHSTPSYHSTTTPHERNYTSTTTRDSHGRIKRSEAAKRDFMTQTGYPHGRKGYVVDHIVPLCKGGMDAPSNMQWQTVAAAKAKDKTECH